MSQRVWLELQRSVQIRYASYHPEPLDRRVVPYDLLFRRQHWYLSGFCYLPFDFTILEPTELKQAEASGAAPAAIGSWCLSVGIQATIKIKKSPNWGLRF
ncbi:WYL domain-containing protein [Alkalimonas sp.]|uniref:WYL domain-containing protein n=1 Tax=Alkalimonas sp. TaxID=1872453 RepID=UPI002A22D20F|nr:WYL domain-containing protein [Alkalimonas sp.]